MRKTLRDSGRERAMGKSPPSRRRLLPFRVGTSAGSGGGASNDREGDTHELIPVTGGDSSSADDSGGGNGDKSQAAPSREKLRLLLVLCLLWTINVFGSSAYSIVGSFFPIQATEKGSNAFTTGLIISATPFTMVILTPLCGYIVPKFGVKCLFVTGMAVLGAAFFLLGFMMDLPSGTVFVVVGVVLRLAEGVGWSMACVTTLAMVPGLFPSHVGTVTGLLTGSDGLGFTIGPPIGSLLAVVAGYRAPFLIVGGLILLLIIPTLLLIKPISYESVLPLCTMFTLLSHLNFTMLLLAEVVAYLALTVLFATLAVFLHNKMGLSEIEVGAIFGAMSASYFLSSLPAGHLTDRFGAMKFIISGLFLGGLSLFVIGSIQFIPAIYKWVIYPGLIILHFSAAYIVVPTYSKLLNQAHKICPEEKEKNQLDSAVSGLTIFALSFGEFLGGLLGGLFTHLTDFPTTALMTGETMLAVAFLVLGVTLIDMAVNWYRKRQSSS